MLDSSAANAPAACQSMVMRPRSPAIRLRTLSVICPPSAGSMPTTLGVSSNACTVPRRSNMPAAKATRPATLARSKRSPAAVPRTVAQPAFPEPSSGATSSETCRTAIRACRGTSSTSSVASSIATGTCTPPPALCPRSRATVQLPSDCRTACSTGRRSRTALIWGAPAIRSARFVLHDRRISSTQSSCRHSLGNAESTKDTPRTTMPSPSTRLAPCTCTVSVGNSCASRCWMRDRTSSPRRLEPMAPAATTPATVIGRAQRTSIQSVSERGFKTAVPEARGDHGSTRRPFERKGRGKYVAGRPRVKTPSPSLAPGKNAIPPACGPLL